MTFATRAITLVSLMVAVAQSAQGQGQAQSAEGKAMATTSRASDDSVVVRAS
jgi:hypothetical protein